MGLPGGNGKAAHLSLAGLGCRPQHALLGGYV
jgi:hypothetical protein